jgi:hypothetical protein
MGTMYREVMSILANPSLMGTSRQICHENLSGLCAKEGGLCKKGYLLRELFTSPRLR